ncbi:MAG: DUF4040 domain-containing protein, partial [Chloroflexi bacterium]|nr:DUF4040 domain-containing protein [Chloroflexota bacterium]
LLVVPVLFRPEFDLWVGGNIVPQFAGIDDILGIVFLVLALAAALVSAVVRKHFPAILAIGVMGYAVGGLFLIEPGPDVALVQFLVETLATVLFVIMLGRISLREREEVEAKAHEQTRLGLTRDILISGIVGLLVGVFALAAVSTRPQRDTIAQWHLDNADVQVGASDVVAGIITDFRGSDTLVEIAVFGMAAIGVLTLLSTYWRVDGERTTRLLDLRANLKNVDEEVLERLPQEESLYLSNPLTRVSAALVLPFALLISASHILYGSSSPGDGFTAGVIAGLAVGLWYVVFGYTETRERLRWLHPGRLIGVGILVQLINASVPLFLGGNFLGFWGGWDLPAGLKFSSTIVFEFAIFLTVFGGMATILEAITHPREVSKL